MMLASVLAAAAAALSALAAACAILPGEYEYSGDEKERRKNEY